MSELEAVSSELSTLSKEIQILSGQVEDKRTEYETAKHAYELAYSGFIITGKEENPSYTQTDLEAYAVRKSQDAKAVLILAHGAYRKLKAELAAKYEALEAVKERGWNLRAELRSLGR